MTLAERMERAGRGRDERGGARFNFVVVVLLIALAAYSAYNYAPIAYHAYLYKDFMQETVNKAAFPPAKANDWVVRQLRAGGTDYDLPEDANIRVQNENGRIVARVTYTRPVQLAGYVYEYTFDHTARSNSFINQ